MKKLLIIGNRLPEPTATAAGTRMLQLIDLFLDFGFSITFLSANLGNDNSEDLEKLSIQTVFIAANDNTFDDLVKNLQPEIVIFDRFYTEEQFGWRVAENCEKALRILDTEDLHFLRFAREKCFLEQREIQPEDYTNELFVRELASIYRCDLSLIISEYEMKLLEKNFKIPSEILCYLPFLIQDIPKFTSFENKNNFISIGNFLHQPNWHTVLSLKKSWKAIRKQLPEAQLEIYGAYLPQKAQELHLPKEGFLIKGKAENVQEVMQKAKVLLAPIPYGAGLKGKLLDSMLYGLPNVTTKIGAEAMTFQNIWNGFITENEDDFIEKSVLLYQNKEVWTTAQNNGKLILDNKFKKELFFKYLQEKMIYLQQNLNQHRTQNFMGKVFLHQTLQASKYMSKWIILKNENREKSL